MGHFEACSASSYSSHHRSSLWILLYKFTRLTSGETPSNRSLDSVFEYQKDIIFLFNYHYITYNSLPMFQEHRHSHNDKVREETAL